MFIGSNLMTGLVFKSTGSWYTVKTLNGKVYQCRIKGKFRIKGIKSTNPIAVGDYVEFELETKNNTVTGVINNIRERKNYIVRKSVNLSKQIHIIAANIDQVFLLITINNPTTYTSFIDRFLVTAEAYHIPAILLFNKSDLIVEQQNKKRKELIQAYTEIGYQCLEISATTQFNLKSLKQLMTDKVSMFSGHSGVGKSTLINILDPDLKLDTKKVSLQHKQGQHTTTFAEMFSLPFGGYIIDTPGIKGFGIVDMNIQEIGDYFPEFFRLKSHCKFNNCLHINEPNCAIKKAVEAEKITEWRYQNYMQLINDEETTYRTDIYST
mgnify:CR=1 FL=1